MSLTVEWSIKSEAIGIEEISKVTGVSQLDIKQMFWDGQLGPAPDASYQVAKITPYAAAALFALQEAKKQGIATDHIRAALPLVAGSTLVQLQLNELAAGRFGQQGGTPNLNIKLWALLSSPSGRDMLAEKLPGGAIQVRRYICFDGSGFFACDDRSEFEGREDSLKMIDTHSVARQITQAMRGKYFATHIG